MVGKLRRRASGLPPEYARLLETHRKRAGDLLTQIDEELLSSTHTYRVSVNGVPQVETYESLKAVPSGQAILNNASDVAVSILVLAAERAFQEMRWGPTRQTLSGLARKRLPATADDVTLLFLLDLRADDKSYWWPELICMLVSVAEQYCKRNPVKPIEAVLRRTVQELESKRDEYGDGRARARARILALLTNNSGSAAELFDKGDNWGRDMVNHPLIRECPSELRGFLVHLIRAGNGPRPSAAWKKRCTQFLKESSEASELTRAMLQTAIDSDVQIETHHVGPHVFNVPWYFKEANKRLLRSAAWAAALVNAEWFGRRSRQARASVCYWCRPRRRSPRNESRE
jgi:hypothetical protein